LLILALTILLTWDPYPTGTGVDRLEATAWVMVPVRVACTVEGEPAECLSYVEAWRETVSVGPTATGLTWIVPDFPSGAVAFIPLQVRACRPDGCCSS